jgi:hypothetical protein
VEAAHSDTLEPNVLLNMILQIVTNIDKRIEIMETTMIKSDILVFPDFILDSKTRMRWCKHSIFSLWLRSAFDSLGFSSSFYVLLNMILQIVTNIDKRIEIMETTMIKSVDDLKKEILMESKKVRESIN